MVLMYSRIKYIYTTLDADDMKSIVDLVASYLKDRDRSDFHDMRLFEGDVIDFNAKKKELRRPGSTQSVSRTTLQNILAYTTDRGYYFSKNPTHWDDIDLYSDTAPADFVKEISERFEIRSYSLSAMKFFEQKIKKYKDLAKLDIRPDSPNVGWPGIFEVHVGERNDFYICLQDGSGDKYWMPG